MTVRRNWMLILNGISILQLVISNFAHAATATPINNMNYSRATKSPIIILRSDKLVVDAGTKFCIKGYADKATIASVRRSGEEMMPWTVGAFANDTVIALNTALIDAGYPTSTTPSRVVIDSLQQKQDTCVNKASTIFTSINVQSLPGSAGYRISLSSKQGTRQYVTRIDRMMMIPMSMEFRNGIKWDAESDDEGKPFWDVGHDFFKLRSNLINHLFQDDRSRHE